MKDKLKLIPASYLFLEKDGKYLFMRRAKTGYQDGNYQVPAGHVEENESPSEAMVREAKEEIGIDLNPDDLEFVQVAYRMNQERTGFRADFFFKASIWKGEIINAEPNKCDDLQWFASDGLPENVVPLMRSVLESMEKGSYLVEAIQ
jgi:8-oxo-dGTP pyrophosphatase MutT (NUDIX family)